LECWSDDIVLEGVESKELLQWGKPTTRKGHIDSILISHC
jgi:hypothetical protein